MSKILELLKAVESGETEDTGKALPNPRNTRRRDALQDRFVGKNRRLKVHSVKMPKQVGTLITTYHVAPNPATVAEVREAMKKDRY